MKRILFITCFLAFVMQVFGQQRQITGTVLDFDGKPLVGVTVLIKGTTAGTITDIDGTYSIDVPQDAKTLVFSFVGMLDEEVQIGNSDVMDVRMAVDLQGLDEVVVIGYGTVKKRDLSGSVSSIDGEALTNMKVRSVEEAMQGRAAGVHITQNNGTPGSSYTIRVRGIGTINNADPLYVVDGIPTGNIDFLGPNDIESIEILKDASATAIYGARGANGVVLITTKGGTSGINKMEFNYYVGVQSLAKKYDLLNGEDYVHWMNIGSRNSGTRYVSGFVTADTNEFGIPNDAVFTTDTDWQDLVFRDALIRNYNLSFSGGSDKTTYLISGDYLDQDGIVRRSYYEKLALRAKIDSRVNNWLTVGSSIIASYEDRRGVLEGHMDNGAINSALRMLPIEEPFNPDGSYFDSPHNNVKNPEAILDNANSDNVRRRLFTKFYGEVEIIKGLKFKSRVGLEYTLRDDYNYNRTFDAGVDWSNDVSSVSRFTQRYSDLAWENILSYNREFGKHSVNLVLGLTAENHKYEDVYASGTNLISENESMRYLNATQDGYNIGGIASEWGLLSKLGRIIYSYGGRYIVTASYRIDESSRFGKNFKKGKFPSASAAWVLSRESFMQDISFLSNAKIRASYGIIGNQNLTGSWSENITQVDQDFPYVALIETSQNYSFGDPIRVVTGAAPLGGSNADVKWEKIKTANVGLDLGFFRQRLQFTADYFIKNTEDMLTRVEVQQHVGFTQSPVANIGEVQNRGIELSVQYKNYDRDFKYDFTLNFSRIKNEVINLDSAVIITGGVFKLGNVSYTGEGYPIASFYGYQVDGIFQTQDEIDAITYIDNNGETQLVYSNAAPGDFRFVDVNGDGIITDLDKTVIGDPWPDFIFGLATNLMYKNFSLNIFLQGVIGNEIFHSQKYWGFIGTTESNKMSIVTQSWTPENTDTEYPRFVYADRNDNLRESDFYVEDASFLRIKNVTLAYDFPAKIIRKIKLNGLRVYLQGQNLYTFTKYTGYDPEMGIRNNNRPLEVAIDQGGTYPPARTILFGFNITL
ncbi:MAG: TonB-dependent receptor [Bacteroidales bacterium]|nr:TonB-dependent receptor [Bacteroidales bacterium]